MKSEARTQSQAYEFLDRLSDMLRQDEQDSREALLEGGALSASPSL